MLWDGCYEKASSRRENISVRFFSIKNPNHWMTWDSGKRKHRPRYSRTPIKISLSVIGETAVRRVHRPFKLRKEAAV